MSHSILIIEDDVAALQDFGRLFETLGWDVYRELSGEAGLASHGRLLPDVVLVDLDLPGIDGLEVVRQLRGSSSAVVMLAEADQQATAVQAMREGAEAFVVTPGPPEHLQAVVERAAEKSRLRRVNRTLIDRGASEGGPGALGESPPMVLLREAVADLARADSRVILIRGETGTGKRTVARLIHDLSPRASEPFIEFLPAASDPRELEAALFGVAGSGEGDSGGSRPGLLDSADGGTLLLHHLELAPLPLQERLEEVLDRGSFRRVGGVHEVPVDLRLMVTTSGDPEAAIEAGQLRRELCYRPGATGCSVPPLRDLPLEDLSRSVARMLRRIGPGMPGAPEAVSSGALERMIAHPWPGNYRELHQVLERAALQARGEDVIGVEHLPPEFRARPGPFDRRHIPLTMEEVERMHIERTLRHHDGNRTRSAGELGISRATLIAKIKKYAIPL
jgi:DNA-binding NtrC family response regulator